MIIVHYTNVALSYFLQVLFLRTENDGTLIELNFIESPSQSGSNSASRVCSSKSFRASLSNLRRRIGELLVD